MAAPYMGAEHYNRALLNNRRSRTRDMIWAAAQKEAEQRKADDPSFDRAAFASAVLKGAIDSNGNWL